VGDGSPAVHVDAGAALDASAADGPVPPEAGIVDAQVERVDDPCASEGGCAPGAWVNVTPTDVDLTHPLTCDNFGVETVQVDPNHPEQLYALFSCQGVWKSTDYGQTWHGPTNTGTGGAMAADCAGGITIPSHDPSSNVTIYQGCIRGNATGFSRSTNGGVDWTHVDINVPGGNHQFYPPVVDPYNPKHLLISGHGVAVLAESQDGGDTWTAAALDPAMLAGATGGINFIDTGDPATTATTWLWLAQGNGTVGTWRTTSGGASWQQVESNSHPGGIMQIYQPDTSGAVYMAGLYSSQGYGVFRSADYGATWKHYGEMNLQERVVFGTPKNVYTMMGNEVQGTGSDPALQIAPQPGTAWTSPPTPPGMTQGPLQATVTSDGAHSIVLLACWSSGLVRYVEP
jgi:hypothetical protein